MIRKFLIVSLLFLLLVSCSKDGGNPVIQDNTIVLSIEPTYMVNLSVGSTTKLKAVIKNASGKELDLPVVWRDDSTGKVEIISNNTAKEITIRAKKKGSSSAHIYLNCQDKTCYKDIYISA